MGVKLEITPEPTPEGREALERALAQLLDKPEDRRSARSAWWRAGIQETLTEPEGELE